MINQRTICALLTAVTALALAASTFATESVDPDNDGSQYAYSANLGWLNAEPQGDGGPGIEQHGMALRGWLWSANAGWISLSCENTASCGTVEYGVQRDGNGALIGYAWSPNLGWISFSCVDSATCGAVNYGVDIDSGSGEMTGYAYAANAGWISFSCQNTVSCGSVDFGIKLAPAGPSPELIFEDGFETL